MIVADSVLRSLKDVHPSATSMLLGMVPGIGFGYSLEDRKLRIGGNHHLEVALRIPEMLTPFGDQRVIRVYLNGELYRPVQ